MALAHVISQQEGAESALPLFDRAASRYNRVLGADHPRTIRVVKDFAATREQVNDR